MINGVLKSVDVTVNDAISVEAPFNAGVVTAPLKGVTVAGKSGVSSLIEAVTGVSSLAGVEMPKLSNILLMIDSRTPCVSIEGLEETGTDMLFVAAIEVVGVGVVLSFAGRECAAVEVAKD